MKNGEEGAGSGRPSPGPAAQEAGGVTPEWEAILCLRSAIYHLHRALAPTGRDEEITSELQDCWKHLAKRSVAPNPSSGEGPSPSTPDRTPDVTHPHPREGRP